MTALAGATDLYDLFMGSPARQNSPCPRQSGLTTRFVGNNDLIARVD